MCVWSEEYLLKHKKYKEKYPKSARRAGKYEYFYKGENVVWKLGCVRVRVYSQRTFCGGVLDTVIIFHNRGRNSYTPREVIPNHARVLIPIGSFK